MIWFRKPDGAIIHDKFRNDPNDLVEVDEPPFGIIQGAQLKVSKDPLNLKVMCTHNSIKEIEFKSLVFNPTVYGLEVES